MNRLAVTCAVVSIALPVVGYAGGHAAPEPDAETRLTAALEAQPESVQARYEHRNPQQTLEFFGIEPGMTVVEVLPGAGWYTKILLPYLGNDGRLWGVDYEIEMFRLFGFFPEERIREKETWVEDWTAEAEEWRDDDSARVSAFVFGALPDEARGTADAALMIRALHNLARFDGDGGFLGRAVQDLYDVLRPGGVLGVVQHHARDDMPDDWADGAAGYLKKDFVVETMESVGFEFVGSSDVNANPADQPTTGDVVWRLPPNFATSRDDPEMQQRYTEIGESNRMTLKFRKPE